MRTPLQIAVQKRINFFWCCGKDNKGFALEPEADALINQIVRLSGTPTYNEMVEYEERILSAEMRAERLKRMIPLPDGPGAYKGDTYYPAGGTEASHEWDGERWVWLESAL